MSDDLSRLTPTDPSNVDPNWSTKRDSILDDALADASRSNRSIGRWVAGVAAIAVIIVGAGVVVGQLGSEPSAIPASPSASVSPIPLGQYDQLVAARDTLIDTGNGMTLCNGSVLESRPPGCPFPTPVTGITWNDVPWAETADGISSHETPGSITFADAIIVGTFDGDAFVATQVFREDDPAAPQPPGTITDEELPTLCDAPTRGTGPDSVEDLIVAAENLPGYQALWVSPNQVTYNVAVTSDVESAQSALTEIFGGELCVGTVDGPTERGLQDAELALEPLKPDVHDPTATISVWNTFSSISTRGNRLEVSVRRNTPVLLDKIQAAVGPEVWPHTDIIPFFYPVEGSATQDSTPSANSPGGTGTPTTPAFTDEQRGWAEEVVGDVLGSVGEPGQPAVTARMAKVTYGQYMSVWNMDIPEPPGPTPDDAEILVVALSASLDGSSMHAGPPRLTTPDPTASQTPREPIGTVTVLDPSTGESLSHATVIGGDPPADLIMNLPGPIEDVALPQGFR